MLTIGLILQITLATGCSTTQPEVITQVQTVISEVPVTVEVTTETIREMEVTRQVEIMRDVEVTRIIEIEVEIVVTATETPTPEASPTPSANPTITPTPTATATPTQTPIPTSTPDLGATATVQAYGSLTVAKGNGIYTVGTEILPGKWRSTGTREDCYWSRLDVNQNIIDNHFGLSGGTVNIRPSDYEVEFLDCGTWEYAEGEVLVLQDDASAPKGNGIYTVGLEIAPGRWESTGTQDDCYWARQTDTQDLIDNHFGNAGGTITIQPTDYEVVLWDCGTWEYRGQ
jgi:hypothetical protein